MENNLFNKSSIKQLNDFSIKNNVSFSLDKSLNVVLSKAIQRNKKEIVIYDKKLNTCVFKYLGIDKI